MTATATGDGAASAEALLVQSAGSPVIAGNSDVWASGVGTPDPNRSLIDALVSGFVSPSVGANGAGSARLTVENLGTVIYDHTFSDSLALLSFFQDGVLEVQPVAMTYHNGPARSRLCRHGARAPPTHFSARRGPPLTLIARSAHLALPYARAGVVSPGEDPDLT